MSKLPHLSPAKRNAADAALERATLCRDRCSAPGPCGRPSDRPRHRPGTRTAPCRATRKRERRGGGEGQASGLIMPARESGAGKRCGRRPGNPGPRHISLYRDEGVDSLRRAGIECRRTPIKTGRGNGPMTPGQPVVAGRAMRDWPRQRCQFLRRTSVRRQMGRKRRASSPAGDPSTDPQAFDGSPRSRR